MYLALTFTTSTGYTTEMRSRGKKDLCKTWLTVCLLIGTSSELHVLRINWHAGLSSGATFLDIEAECNLETVYNGGKSALPNTKELVILYEFVNR